MNNGGELTSINPSASNKICDRIRILAICVPENEQMGDALETLLRPVQGLSVWRERAELASCKAGVEGASGNDQPSVVVVCIPPVSAYASEPILDSVQKKYRPIPIIAILETSDRDCLPWLFNVGISDFSLMPLRLEDLLPRLMRWALCGSNMHTLPPQLEEHFGLQQVIGMSRTFVEAINRIPKFARCDASVFITGETGTGKEMCARAIHDLGPRADQPFVAVNCGAIPSELVENELFGHEIGAFTGASSAVQGLIHDAEGGTLFLDETECLPLQTQVKFLRFLQDREYRPLGGRKVRRADVRIIAAANTDLEAVVQSGRFRSDLLYRLNILPLKLPPLRERREDIPLLARHFVAKYARELSTPAKEISRSALNKLLFYEWPGNVRELENILERALVLSDQPIITSEDICLPRRSFPAEEPSFKELKARAIREFESSYIRRMLAANEGNISKAARAAMKNRRAFWQLMRKHDIAPSACVAAHALIGQMPSSYRTDLS